MIQLSLRQCVIAACALGAAWIGVAPAQAGTLEDVKGRGVVRCGIAPNSPGFATKDAQGVYRGFDVDYCRAIAAAVLGDGSKVELSPLGLREAFATLATGGVDVLTHRFTWTFNRDNGTGIETVLPLFFDGQGFFVRKSANIKSVKELNGATICVAQGSTSELNLADYFRANNMKFQEMKGSKIEDMLQNYESDQCNVLTADVSQLYALRLRLSKPDEHAILPDVISKEPLAPVVRQKDDDWLLIVKWTLYAMLNAEELGINSKNIDDALKSKKPEVMRLVGTEGAYGVDLGLTKDWAARVIRHVGNYAEVYERNVGVDSPLKIPRGLNQLWSQGGIQYAPPIR
jgi:general L-amino acid transport system substrate-binding protein